jgi:hypothetical protein
MRRITPHRFADGIPHCMKIIATLVTSLVLFASLPLIAAEPITPKPTVEQRFQEADISLALAQYEKLQMSAFEIRLKLELDPPAGDEQRAELTKKAHMLTTQAHAIRDETLKRAQVVAAATR